MNFLFLSKRFPQGRDLLTRPYGRFYYLAKHLAARGHRVHVALLSYRLLPSTENEFDGITWTSDDLLAYGPKRYLDRQNQLVKQISPDWVVGLSDTYFGIMARRLATRHGVRFAIDAYDDFEAYLPWARPLHRLWRRALASANLVTAAGPHLAALLATRATCQPEVLPMAADPQFRSLDRAESRRALGLPAERLLIGQLGAFDRRRGADVVLRALDRVRAAERAVSLVLSGSKSLDRHAPPDILGVGFVADSDMPALVNCLDVACVSLSDNAFGRASYPAKLCEAMACRIPVVATDLGPTRWMLDNDDRALAASGDPDTMAKKILARLREGRCNYAKIPSWDLIADQLEGLLLSRN